MDNIIARDVFVSWTGADEAQKTLLCNFLVENGISCTDSATACHGNFAQWSVDAATSCSLFVVLLSENWPRSTYMPLELEAAACMPDADNRIVPVCLGADHWTPFWHSCLGNTCPDDPVAADRWQRMAKISRPMLAQQEGLTGAALEQIVRTVRSLLLQRTCAIYRHNTRPDYIKLEAMCGQRVGDKNYDYSTLYIPRDLRPVANPDDPPVVDGPVADSGAIKQRGVCYIFGPSGCGKSQYINQIRLELAPDEECIALPCTKLVRYDDLYEAMYEAFAKGLGNRYPFAHENFNRILAGHHIVLVLDGLDEVATTEGTDHLAAMLDDYYDTYCKNTANRLSLVVTGRDAHAAARLCFGPHSPQLYRLNPLSEEQIEQLGRNLFVAFGDADKSTDFYIEIRSLGQDIRTNPMLLSQLAIIYDTDGRVPTTTFGILDKISQIILRPEARGRVNIDNAYAAMVRNSLDDILARLARTKYLAAADGAVCETQPALEQILVEIGYDDEEQRAAFLVDYLRQRAIYDNDEFYHKMFAEYYTAKCYYKAAYRARRLQDEGQVSALFAHYADPYWQAVLHLFLVMADSNIACDQVSLLYNVLCTRVRPTIVDYTLLLDACRDLLVQKQPAQVAIARDLLAKAAAGEYAPYGPLFWYVPHYNLYRPMLLALEGLRGNAAALALARDVCAICGLYGHMDEVTDAVDGPTLYAACRDALGEVRDALCCIFYTHDTPLLPPSDICPRCFDPHEALSWREQGQGMAGTFLTPFADPLSLYQHQMYSMHNGEYMGLVAVTCDNDITEATLARHATRCVYAMVFGQQQVPLGWSFPHVYYGNVRSVLWPESCPLNYALRVITDKMHVHCTATIPHQYKSRRFVFPDNIHAVPANALYSADYIESIFVPDGVTAIEAKAFAGCARLRAIRLPATIVTIGNGAFDGCRSLQQIAVGANLTHIGDRAFAGCKALQHIDVSNVDAIPISAFAGCSNLSSVVLPRSLHDLGDDAFAGCVALQNITLTDDLSHIGTRAFCDCSALTALTLPASLESLGMGAFRRSGLRKLHLPKDIAVLPCDLLRDCVDLVEITLPAGLKQIEESAFENCRSLTNIDIPNGVESIGHSVFKHCICLQSLHLPDSVREIGTMHTFAFCAQLQSITIPYGIRTIGGFGQCNRLQSVVLPDTIEQIDDFAFADCVALRHISLPPTITNIGCAAFRGAGLLDLAFPDNVAIVASDVARNCTALTSVSLPVHATQIDANAFDGCAALRSLALPNTLSRIDEGAFAGCLSLVELTIPDGVSYLGDGALKNCTNLHRLSMPSPIAPRIPYLGLAPTFSESDTPYAWIEVRHIECVPHTAFSLPLCTTLTAQIVQQSIGDNHDIIVPEGVTKIDDNAFCGTYIHSVDIPASVLCIGQRAFAECAMLDTVRFATNGQLQQIGDKAFEHCPNLHQINLPERLQTLGEYVFRGCVGLVEVRLPALEHLSRGTFFACRHLSSIDLPDSFLSLDKEVFSACENLCSIRLPAALQKVGAYAFERCTSLQSVTLPSNVATVEQCAFANCTALQTVILNNALATIDECAFRGCSSLAEISFPNSLSFIGISAFAECSALQSVCLPPKITEVRSQTFFACKNLRSAILPHDIGAIGGFANCSALNSITIPDGVHTIKANAFYGSGLQKLYLPDSVKNIGHDALRGCTQLTDVRLPDALSIIATRTFAGCTRLTKVHLPDNVVEIRPAAFADCYNLTSVRIGPNVKSIGERAFAGCARLKEIVVPAGVYSIGNDAFAGCIGLTSISIGSNFKGDIPRLFGTIDAKIIHWL